ncbi:hypothetical protein VIA_002065 [Vibrio orientalis CIP 102891 = ATCC 33934]|nr:hypothetical protein VIA_002065 [Vibrio orientalis CIP 102891 = ATCC 33934]
MAVFEHYTGYLNYWYVDFFIRESAYWNEVYSSHLPMANTLLPMDALTGTVSAYLVPWVSQIYLALASFNLAIKPQNLFKPQLFHKLMLFGVITLVLYFEGLIVAPNFGEAISFYPVMLWMLLLALFSTVYALAGIKGMLGLSLLSLLLAPLGFSEALSYIESSIQHLVHPGFELDARIDLFMTSGCFGFIYGWFWHQKPSSRALCNQVVFTLSAIAIVIYLSFGEPIAVDITSIYAEEHTLAEDFFGKFGIWGMEFLVISSVLHLHLKGFNLNVRFINWIGMYSLTVFIFHKAIFVFLWGPLMLLITAKLGITLVNSFSLVFTLSSLSIVMIYVLKRSGVVDHLMGTHQDKTWANSYQRRANKPHVTQLPAIN